MGSQSLPDMNMDNELPNLSAAHVDVPTQDKLNGTKLSTHPPRILLLYGSLREKSYSRLLTLEAERLL
jgi:arsenic resistance protein ArsH